MGILDFLFSPKPSNVTQTTTQQLGPEQQSIFAAAFPYAKQYASTPLQQFGGSGIAPLSPQEQQAQQMYQQNAGGVTQGLATNAANAQNAILDPQRLNVTQDPLIQNQANAVREAVTRNLQENILPGTRQSAIQGGGMFSGGNSRAGIAEGKAIGDTNLNLGNTLSSLFSNAYNSAANRQQGAISANPSVMNQQNMPADMLASVGAQNRSQEQAQLDEQIRKFYTGQMLPFMQSQELMSLLQGMPGGSTTSNVQGSTAQPSAIQQLLGLGLTGAVGAGALGYKPFGT